MNWRGTGTGDAALLHVYRHSRAALVALVMAAACEPVGLDDDSTACGDLCDQAGARDVGQRRDHLLDHLRALSRQDRALFGQQSFNVRGIAPSPWQASAGSVADSDVEGLVGRHPAVLGLEAWDIAIKPESWDVRPAVQAEAARWVAERGGVVTVSWHMRGCDRSEESDAFWAEGNEDCLCRLANDDSYARAWLEDGKLSRFADALQRYQLDEFPIVFRPLHEHTESWFWWGTDFWDCAGMRVQGADAYRRVFRRIVDYLRIERGLDNLLVAYSPANVEGGFLDFASLEERYFAGYPGDNYVDVLGLDFYYQPGDDHADETDELAEQLREITRQARWRHKAAALTEVGNMSLLQEGLDGQSRWYEKHLLELLDDPQIHLAYALTWDNRSIAAGKFFVPTGTHPGVADFEAFFDAGETLFMGQGPDLYQPADIDYPTCHRCSSDKDGDGWGWEAHRSCLLASWCMSH